MSRVLNINFMRKCPSLCSRTKLLKHAAPILCPPSNVDITTIPKEMAKTFHKNRGRQKKKPLARAEIGFASSSSSFIAIMQPANVITLDKVLDIFKKHATNPWSWHETTEKFYFSKCDLPPKCESKYCLPLMPMVTECLMIDKTQNGKMQLIRRGEIIALKYVAPEDYDDRNETVLHTTWNVKNFIQKLKARNDPVPSIPEALQLHANAIDTIGKSCLGLQHANLDDRLGTALIFLSNQLSNWVTKCTEYNKLPNFVPSTIRMALLVRAQSKAAYAVRYLILFSFANFYFLIA